LLKRSNPPKEYIVFNIPFKKADQLKPKTFECEALDEASGKDEYSVFDCEDYNNEEFTSQVLSCNIIATPYQGSAVKPLLHMHTSVLSQGDQCSSNATPFVIS
jgi:hypothetical protein